MSPESATLQALAESIADGSPVDWDAAETRADASERGVIRQLRLLADVAVLHRSLPANPVDWPPPWQPRRELTTAAIGNWGHLALLERLGSGTSGDVYRAWDRQLEREVALKLLRVDETLGDPRASHIAREGRLLARIRHPNVITVFGVAVHDARVGLWMDLVRGATLEQTLRDRGPFSAREAALIGVDLCRALAAIHAAGLIHRDVKAQNVMREDGGRIVLMDLGTSRESAMATELATDMAGTPLYLAPEIFTGAPAGARTDIYSLGVLLYRLVTGAFPIDVATLDELREAHASRKAGRLRDVRPDLPAAFVRVVERALTADPEHRYGSAGALEADLVNAIDDRPETVPASRPDRHEPHPSRTSRTHSGRTWAIAVAAAAAIVLVTIVAVLSPRWRQPSTPAGAPGPIRSIAVLPLLNLSGDSAQDYFADGITDELISTLGRVDRLNVISRTSVMQFKGSNKPISAIARLLRVDAVLEGSVVVQQSAAGDGGARRRVRINARLIAAGTDTQVWNREFEEFFADALLLQSQVAEAITEGLNLHLTRQQQQLLAPAAPVTRVGAEQVAEAVDLYLKGRYSWNLRTEEGLKQSAHYFREAIERDPGLARAHAGLADAYTLLAVYGFLPGSEAFGPAEAAAKKALEIDGSLGEAHASLALVHMERLEWNAAVSSFKRALALKPGYATGHHWYSAYLAQAGNLTGAMEAIERARALDPLSLSVSAQRAAILLLARRTDDAIRQLEEIVAANPAFVPGYKILADAHAQRGDYDRALTAARKAAELGDRSIDLRALTGYIHAKAGRRADALAIAEELAGRARQNVYGAAGGAATVYAGLRDVDAAFGWLERARSNREPWIAYLKVDPKWDPIRSDPRFERLLVSAELPR